MLFRQCLMPFLVGLLCALSTPFVGAQTTTPDGMKAKLPRGFELMSPEDFAAAVRVLQESDTYKFLSFSDELAARTKGKNLFLEADLSSTQLDYLTLEMLHWVARSDLDSFDIDRARKALLSHQDDWTGRSYEEVRAKVKMMMRFKVDEATIISESRRWLQAGGSVDQIPAADRALAIVRRITSNVQIVEGSFSVLWEGQLVPPQTGAYKLCISPINLTAAYDAHPVKFDMSITVNGQVVLTTVSSAQGTVESWVGRAAWPSESQVVTLTGGQPVRLSVSATVVAKQRLPSGALHALLLWKTPGSDRAVLVPSTSLRLPNGDGQGLKATYSWRADGAPQIFTRTDPTIDFAWTGQRILLEQDSASQLRADALWQELTSQSSIAATVGPPVKLHRFLQNPEDSSAILTTEQRSAFLGLLLQNPSMLGAMDAKQFARFFKPFRIGVPDKAMDVFGAWSTRNADLICDVSTDRVFNGDQRVAFAALSIQTTQQLPEQFTTLQSKYLQLEDGRCSLPAAYVLACSYLSQKKFSDWVAILDAKLKDPSISGDTRVNWLLARANAQELNPSSASHYPHYYPAPAHNPLRGRSFLDQALESAQSDGAKVRVAKEIVGRLIWKRDFEGAKAVLQSIAGALSDDQKAPLAAMHEQLDNYIAARQQYKQDQPELSKQAHLNELRIRRDRAAKLGDAAETSRYDALIDAAASGR